MLSDVSNHCPTTILHGLDQIYRTIRNYSDKNPVLNDFLSDQVVLNAWPHVTMTYSLLEQSLKAIVLLQNNNYSKKKMKQDSHCLNQIYWRIEMNVKNSLREDIARSSRSITIYRTYNWTNSWSR